MAPHQDPSAAPVCRQAASRGLNRSQARLRLPLRSLVSRATQGDGLGYPLGPACRQRGILNPKGVQALLEEHDSGQVNYGKRIWTLLALEKWFLQVEGN